MKLLRYSGPFTSKREVFDRVDRLIEENARLYYTTQKLLRQRDELSQYNEELQERLFDRTPMAMVTDACMGLVGVTTMRIPEQSFGVQLRARLGIPGVNYHQVDEPVQLTKDEIDIISRKFAPVVVDYITAKLFKENT